MERATGTEARIDPFAREGEGQVIEERKCRICGCTDDDCSGCIERTGQPCYWVDDDLCSACEGRHEEQRPEM